MTAAICAGRRRTAPKLENPFQDTNFSSHVAICIASKYLPTRNSERSFLACTSAFSDTLYELALK